MKKKDFMELRSKEPKDLAKLVKDKKAQLAKITPEIALGKEKNFKKASILRREIAQILTLIREKEIANEENKAEGKKI